MSLPTFDHRMMAPAETNLVFGLGSTSSEGHLVMKGARRPGQKKALCGATVWARSEGWPYWGFNVTCDTCTEMAESLVVFQPMRSWEILT